MKDSSNTINSFSTYEVELQVSYRVCAKISQESIL